jgi:glutamate--cysteine ligase
MLWRTEHSLAEHLDRRCFELGPTGFVTVTVDVLPVALVPMPPPAEPVSARLRHGLLSGDFAGVLTVSTPASPGLDVAVRRMTADLGLARSLMAREGFAPGERAVDPHGAAGVAAGVRIGLDAGATTADLDRRWRLAHAVGPVLAAAFANSPLRAGRATGWRSTRLAGMTPAGPRRAWPAYVLDHPADGGSLRHRLRGGDPITPQVLDRHLDRLTAPILARGQLELAMIDAQPGDVWRVALAVTTALIDDLRAGAEAERATADLPPDAWTRAARDGLTDPLLAGAARSCFVAAYAALARQGADRTLRDAVATYVHRYVSRGRTPADDLLDARSRVDLVLNEERQKTPE